MFHTRLLILAIALLQVSFSNAITCPPFNPPLPINAAISGRPALRNATANITISIETALTEGLLLDNASTSFSIDLYALTDKGSLFNYHFSAPDLSNATEGVQEVDSNTIYRMGSISKVFTVYTYLASVGDVSWNQPITRYVPELAQQANFTGELDVVRWQDVTIGALAAQLAGIARQSAPNSAGDMLLALSAGFPPIPSVEGDYCNGSVGAQFPCDREDFFINLFDQHPVVPPESSPVYSNIAYLLLAYALENMTETRFPRLMNETIISPLYLNSTYYPLPCESAAARAVIPINDATAGYSTDLRSLRPGGAVYSTANDMRLLGKSILNSTLLSQPQTRRWLKPHSFSPDTWLSIGAPWEIINYPPESRFPVRIFSKAGDIGLYSTQMGLIPDYNVGFTVLAAGVSASGVSRVLSDLVVSNLVPAIKQIAVTQANQTYAGTYRSDDGTNSSVTLSLTLNEGEVGSTLRIDSLVWNSTDLITLYSLALGVEPTTQEITIDIFPTGLKQQPGKPKVILESWRASFNVQPLSTNDTSEADLGLLGPYSTSCGAWAGVDGFVYGGVGVDEIVFQREETKVTAIDVRFLQQGFWTKVP